jgi:hypothetical protein
MSNLPFIFRQQAKLSVLGRCEVGIDNLMEAADEIERLTAEVLRLREWAESEQQRKIEILEEHEKHMAHCAPAAERREPNSTVHSEQQSKEKTMHEKMPCSITDGPQSDDNALDDYDEFLCNRCRDEVLQHPGICEECRAELKETNGI